MTKRRLAALCVTIFVLSVLASVQQVSAHYTLGAQLPNSIGEKNAGGLPVDPSSGAGNGFNRFHKPSDWQGHIPGHIAFVEPGSLYVPPSDQNNYYSPNGAVLTNTTGDLFVYICVSDDLGDGQTGPINISWRAPTTALTKWLYIAIPPEFTPPVNWTSGVWARDDLTINGGRGDSSNIETTITNDHNFIQIGKFNPRHPIAPNWWFVRFTATPVDFPQSQIQFLTNLNPSFNPKYTDTANPIGSVYRGSSGFLYPPNMDPWLDRQISPNNTNGIEKNFAGCYRIKILNMKAPSCAGKYFFKIFYTSSNQPMASIGVTPYTQTGGVATSAIYGSNGGWPDAWQVPDSPYGQSFNIEPWVGYLNTYFEKYDSFAPENYPVVLVKGEVDPGYISGTVRYCGHSQYYYGSYYGAGVETSGKVIVTGTSPAGTAVCGEGWFLGEVPGQGDPWKDRGTGSAGYYEIEGLAPGVYTLTAYAAGFVPQTLATQITVSTGQSIHGVDIYVCPTAKLQTKVYSKCPTGPVDWPLYVTLDGYPASMTILPVVPGGADVRGTSSTGAQGSPVGPNGVWYWFTEGATTVQAKNIWNDLTSKAASAGATPYDPDPLTLGASMNAYNTPAIMNSINKTYGWAWQELVDTNGTTVAYKDFCFDIRQDPRTFGTFWGDPSCYSGIETSWDGHVPTFLADFTSGITPGTYTVRTWVYGYVQTQEYTVNFPSVEFPGTAYMEMDLFKGGTINATVHFHLQELPSAEMTNAQFDNVPNLGLLLFEAYDANGVLQAWNSTDDYGWWQTRDQSRGQSLTLIGEPNAWCEDGRVHGMPEGTYTIKAYLRNFIQQEFPQQTLQYCTNGTLSLHIVRGALINMTIYSRDCQDPAQPVNWTHPGYEISVTCACKISPPEYEGSLIQFPYYIGVGTFQDAKTNFVEISVGGSGGAVADYLRYCAIDWTRPKGAPSCVYSIWVYTPGYVQLQIPEVYAMEGSSVGDIPVYLLVGPEIRVTVDFKTELIPALLPKDFYSYYFRIEAFDENGTLVAGNITAVPQATWATYSQYPWMGALNPAQPGGVQSWVFQLFGFSSFTTPTNTPNWIGPGGYTVAPFYPPTGNDLDEYPVYKVARSPTSDKIAYGFMWGRTYTIMVSEENQAGYIQLATVTATPTCKGITTVVFEMDRMARISGTAYTRNYVGDFRSGSWQTIKAQSATATVKTWGPMDGYYYTYVTPDTYKVTASGPGYKSASITVVTTWGGSAGGQDFYLEESGLPIPEFPAAGLLALVSALAASLLLLRRNRYGAIPFR